MVAWSYFFFGLIFTLGGMVMGSTFNDEVKGALIGAAIGLICGLIVAAIFKPVFMI